MAQIFHRSTNTLSRLSIFGAVFIIGGLFTVGAILVRSPYVTNVGVPVPQPVLFSHKHHVGDDGIDCRYCHASVEVSAFAGMPATETCMHCHSQLFNDSPMLQPVTTSAATGLPIAWNRVYQLPDFVYFDHSIHVNKGVGCTTCHGQVDEMPLIQKATSLQMTWCLECHRDPARFVRPRDEVFSMTWQPPPDQAALGAKLVSEYHITSKTNCWTCHR
ncbi:MAG: cytochrome c3 family protein [Anaerolineae bacterium]|nr:cytochrome c3 family protein [Anaerolineae bacterium]